MKGEVQAFLSALQFLTRMPAPAWAGWEDGRLDRAAKWFPWVGVLVGLNCGVVFWAASHVFNSGIAAAMALAAGALVTGALHEDGLADTADGLGGGRDRAHRLSIMKDSRIGTYGALALILTVALKLAALAQMQPVHALLVLVAAHTASRAMMPVLILVLPYARAPEDAKVPPLSPRADPWALALILAALGFAIIVGGIAGTLLCVGVASLVGWVLRCALGGWTGDGIGAVQQLSETAFLLGAIASWS